MFRVDSHSRCFHSFRWFGKLRREPAKRARKDPRNFHSVSRTHPCRKHSMERSATRQGCSLPDRLTKPRIRRVSGTLTIGIDLYRELRKSRSLSLPFHGEDEQVYNNLLPSCISTTLDQRCDASKPPTTCYTVDANEAAIHYKTAQERKVKLCGFGIPCLHLKVCRHDTAVTAAL